MSKIKRYYMPEIYELVDGVTAEAIRPKIVKISGDTYKATIISNINGEPYTFEGTLEEVNDQIEEAIA